MGNRNRQDPFLSPTLNLASAVDLNTVVNRGKYQHSWVMLAKFAVSGDVLEEMAAYGEDLRGKVAEGLAPDDSAAPQIPMSGENLVSLDGPGCGKCGLHWMAEKGYGELCAVSDDDVLGGMEKSVEMPTIPNNISVMEQCPVCEGEEVVAQNFGIFDSNGAPDLVECPECEGSGTIMVQQAREENPPSLLLVK